MMKSQIITEFIKQVWNEGRIESISDFISDTYTVFHDPGDPWDGQVLDVSGFENRVSVSRAPVPDQCFEILELYESGNTVCVTWNWSGTHQGEIAGIPASRKTLTMSGATVYHFIGNRICGHWQIADRMGIYQQLMENQNAPA